MLTDTQHPGNRAYPLLVCQPALSWSCHLRQGLQCFKQHYLEVGERPLFLPFDFLFSSAALFPSWQQKLVPVPSCCYSQSELGPGVSLPTLLGPSNPYFSLFSDTTPWCLTEVTLSVLRVPFALAGLHFLYNRIPCIKSSLFKCRVRFLFFSISPD